MKLCFCAVVAGLVLVMPHAMTICMFQFWYFIFIGNMVIRIEETIQGGPLK